MPFKKQLISLVLSGAGTYGSLEAGAALALYEKEIKPNELIGTSAGSIIAALIALGMTPYEFKDILISADYQKLIPFSDWSVIPFLWKGYMASNHNVIEWLIKITNNATVRDLVIPLTTVTTDLYAGKTVAIKSLEMDRNKPIWEMILPSMSIPDIFPAYENRYVDGGVADNLGINFMSAKSDIKIALRVNEPLIYKETNSIIARQKRLLSIMLSTSEVDMMILGQHLHVDLINLPANGAGFLDTTMSKMEKIKLYETGYEAVNNFFEKKGN